jgi:DNA-binding transcriptional LysR family regulator
MLLRNLRYLAALAREGHFARAARACAVTQPTLSAGIKQLEEELGLLLVRRGQRFEGLTSEGEKVLGWARRILADTESLEQEASELREGLVGRLRLGAIPVTLPILSLLTGPFLSSHPRVTVTILSLNSIDIQRGLDDFSLDAGVTYLDNEPLTHVRTIPLYRERFFFFTPAGGPLAGRKKVSWAEAASQPLCLLTPDMQNRRILDAQFSDAGAAPQASVETNSVLTLWAHVRSGAWSTVLPHPFLYMFGQPEGLKAIPLDPGAHDHTIGLVVPDRDPLTPSARELLQLAEKLDLARSMDAGLARGG